MNFNSKKKKLIIKIFHNNKINYINNNIYSTYKKNIKDKNNN